MKTLRKAINEMMNESWHTDFYAYGLGFLEILDGSREITEKVTNGYNVIGTETRGFHVTNHKARVVLDD